jgi:hypothetical protein
VEGTLGNLWHGDLKDRGYRTRFEGLAPFDFDPYADIALDGQGCWRWQSAKPGLHEYVRRFFALRHEDGRADQGLQRWPVAEASADAPPGPSSCRPAK